MLKKNVLGVDIHKVLKTQPLSEAALGMIPDFKIDEAVDTCVDRLASHIKSYILQDRSKDPVQRNEAITDAAIVLDEIREEMKEMIKDKLFTYSRS